MSERVTVKRKAKRKESKKELSSGVVHGKTPLNRVELSGVVASAPEMRNGVLSRRIEVPIVGEREILEVECEKPEIIKLFRSLKVGEWISLEGALRKRFWRSGASLSSRSYVELHSIKSVRNRPAASGKKR
jgi:hypothetical protein